MKKYVCDLCGWVYDEAAGDPEHDIAPGTKWEDLPCRLCLSAVRRFQGGVLRRGVIPNCLKIFYPLF